MRFSRQKYVLFLSSCLGLVSFFKLIQLLIPALTLIVIIILFASIAFLTLQLLRSINKEQQSDVFNLSSPTAFDNGFLIFKSRSGKYAVFFTVALSLLSIDFRGLERTLKILLKVFPKSTVFSIEWVTNKECYASFYFKVNKDAIITRTRELVENIQTSFKSIFGNEHVRILSERELISHLAYGAQGKIGKATSVGRFSVKLKTGMAQRIISLFQSPIGTSRVKAILKEIPKNGSYRIILSVKKTSTQQSMAICLNIISSTSRKCKHTTLNQLATKGMIHRMPASGIIRFIGDILTRNFPESEYHHISFNAAVKEISSFVKQCSICSNRIQDDHSTTLDSLESIDSGREWREVIETLSEQLEMRIEKNVFLSIHGFPLRIDVKIQDVFLKIIPEYYSDITKLQWLIIQLSEIIKRKIGKCVILLPDSPIIAPLLEEVLNETENKRGIQVITSKHDLQILLSRRKTDLIDPVEIMTQAV